MCLCAVYFSAPEELRSIIQEVKYRTGLQSAKLIRQLRRRDRLCHKLQKNYDIITACLQAVSQKRCKNTHLLLLYEDKMCVNFREKFWNCSELTTNTMIMWTSGINVISENSWWSE